MVPGAMELDRDPKFDRQGKPLTQDEWAKLQHNDYRFVRRTRLAGLAWVVTLWEGTDPYRFLKVPGDPSQASSPHLIFETAVFRPTTGKGIRMDTSDQRWEMHDTQVRHATEPEALSFHNETVARLCLAAKHPVVVEVVKVEL